MRHIRAWFAILILALVACGDDGDGDGAVIDAAAPVDGGGDAPGATNALGQVCSVGSMNCPAGNTCVSIQGVGSTTSGFCSPMCNNMNALCARDYTGPVGGMTFCALTPPGSITPNLCMITCTIPAHCPTGLACLAVPDSTTRVCAPPA